MMFHVHAINSTRSVFIRSWVINRFIHCLFDYTRKTVVDYIQDVDRLVMCTKTYLLLDILTSISGHVSKYEYFTFGIR